MLETGRVLLAGTAAELATNLEVKRASVKVLAHLLAERRGHMLTDVEVRYIPSAGSAASGGRQMAGGGRGRRWRR